MLEQGARRHGNGVSGEPAAPAPPERRRQRRFDAAAAAAAAVRFDDAVAVARVAVAGQVGPPAQPQSRLSFHGHHPAAALGHHSTAHVSFFRFAIGQ